MRHAHKMEPIQTTLQWSVGRSVGWVMGCLLGGATCLTDQLACCSQYGTACYYTRTHPHIHPFINTLSPVHPFTHPRCRYRRRKRYAMGRVPGRTRRRPHSVMRACACVRACVCARVRVSVHVRIQSLTCHAMPCLCAWVVLLGGMALNLDGWICTSV
jgi:hypothetical protein